MPTLGRCAGTAGRVTKRPGIEPFRNEAEEGTTLSFACWSRSAGVDPLGVPRHPVARPVSRYGGPRACRTRAGDRHPVPALLPQGDTNAAAHHRGPAIPRPAPPAAPRPWPVRTGPAFVAKSTVSELENAKKTPGVGTARALDRALNAGGELARLVTDVDKPDTDRLAYVAAHPRRLDSGAVDALADLLAASRRLRTP